MPVLILLQRLHGGSRLSGLVRAERRSRFAWGAALRKQGQAAEITLVNAGAEILRGYSAGTVRRVRRVLEQRGVALRLETRVIGYEQGTLTDDRGKRWPADLVIWAVAAAASQVLKGFDLPRAADGFLAVGPTLQSTGGAPVFVVGDTAAFVQQPLPKAGVYAVREGPVLWENLQRIFAGQPLVPYRPQSGFLSLLADGEGRAFLDYKGFSAKGRWVW